MTTAPQSRQDARPAPLAPGAPLIQPTGAVPLAPKASPEDQPFGDEEILAIAKDAASRCACVIAGFAKVLPDRLAIDTRGNPREAFARQLWMAGMVRALGFSSAQVGAAVGRHKDTVEHALTIIDALYGGDPKEMLAALGEPGVREFLGGRDLVITTDAQGRMEVVSGGEAVEELTRHAERLLDDMFAAFELVAVRGSAFCREIARRAGANP